MSPLRTINATAFTLEYISLSCANSFYEEMESVFIHESPENSEFFKQSTKLTCNREFRLTHLPSAFKNSNTDVNKDSF